MASRLVLHLASAAARSARGHHLHAGRTWAPAMATTTGEALQGVRHYGTPSNHSVTELNRAMRKVEIRLDELEKKGDIGHKPLSQEVLKKHKLHEKEHAFHRSANAVMAVGFGITFSVIMYYRFPRMSAEPRCTV